METSSADSMTKPTLSSTKSIDEGFESDPDREQSNAETESNNLPTISHQSIVTSQPTNHTFDILQRTDRDGVQHTQIARRPHVIEIFENNLNNGNLRRNNDLENGRVIYPNPKVSIPRAGATNHRLVLTTNSAIPSNSSINNNLNTNIESQQRHRFDGKSIELNNSRLAKSTELMLRSSGGGGAGGRERMNAIDNPSQVALINGKLICINMPITQIIQASPMPSTSKSSMAIASHNHTPHTKRQFLNSNNNNANIINQATKLNNHQHHHHQKYISNGRCIRGGTNEPNTHAQHVNKSIMQNANSSMYTFYPAEGNISLIPSQYGLKYKSSHLNGIQEQPAPISLWSQSLARPSRRLVNLFFSFIQ